MLTMIIAMALAAAPQTAPAAPAVSPHVQHMQKGQMDHPKMGQMNMGQHGDGCCKKGADGKMACAMSHKAGSGSTHQDHSGN